MSPKKSDLERTMENLRKDVQRIVALEQSMGEMQKQMSKFSVLLDRLEQGLIQETEEEGSDKTITPIQERNQPMRRRLKIPLFDGDNAYIWIIRVEQYFELSDFTEEQKSSGGSDVFYR